MMNLTLVGTSVERLEMQARDHHKCQKKSLTSNSCVRLGAQKSDSVDSVHLPHEGFHGNWPRGHLCHIQANILAVLCLCPENFPETDFESHGLINLLEEISRKNNIQNVAWLLLSTFIPIYWEEGGEKYFFQWEM